MFRAFMSQTVINIAHDLQPSKSNADRAPWQTWYWIVSSMSHASLIQESSNVCFSWNIVVRTRSIDIDTAVDLAEDFLVDGKRLVVDSK